MNDNKENGAKPLSQPWPSPGIMGNPDIPPETYETLVAETGRQILTDLQTFLIVLVKAKDDQLIEFLKTCTEDLFRRASICRKHDKDWALEDDE